MPSLLRDESATARSIPRSSLAGVNYVAANITTAEGCTLVAHSALDHLGGIDIVVSTVIQMPAANLMTVDLSGERHIAV